MSWKNWLPFTGDRSVRKKLRELDSQGIGTPMIIALFLQKSFELILKQLGTEIPIPLWATFFLAALLTFTIWLYDKQLRKKASETAEKAKDKAEEKVEE
jgi:flagellar biosynthesis component FlhA